MSEPLIEFKNVSKRFGQKVVLDSVNLSIYSGEVTTLIGKSGAGKSVTLKLIIGLLKPDEGEIFYKGTLLQNTSRREKKEIKRQVNFMFQNNALFDSLNIFENIALPLKERTKLSKQEIVQKVRTMMEVLDLHGIELKFPSQISGGMQKRVALARALITDPEIVLFDEPTTGLDPVRKKSVLNMITHNKKNFGFTAVMVSHDVPDVFYISNQVAIIEEGKILFQGPPMELEQCSHQVVQEFTHSQESLENELVGLLTRRSLEQEYSKMQADLSPESSFLVVVFSIQNYSRILELVGHMMAQTVISTIADMIKKHMLVKNSLYGRYSQDRIVCILPQVNKEYVKKFISLISNDLQKKEIFQKSEYTLGCVDFYILAGITIGTKGSRLYELAQEAIQEQEVLASLICEKESH